jgi:hypothetical protein
MAGSGGEMSTGEMSIRTRKPKQGQARRSAASEPGGEQAGEQASQQTCEPASQEPSQQLSQEGSDGCGESGNGFESMRSAVERQLGQNSRQIAEAFGKKAAGGDLNSAKFLVAVAVAEKKTKKTMRKKRDGPTEAQRLALEPQWQDPSATDTEAGSAGGKQ